MNADMPKTLLLLAAAAGLSAGAYFTRPGFARTNEELAAGPFFKDLKDEQIKGLEIVAWDDAAGGGVPFRVQRGDQGWTIPSKSNYPADAKDSLSKSTSWMATAQRDALVTRNKAEHKSLGVLSPEGAAANAGAGTLFKLLDGSGNAFAQMIVGAVVEGRTDYRYVRDPAEEAVYVARLANYGGTTRFSDWIEKDLLELQEWGPRSAAGGEGNFKKTVDRIVFADYIAKNDASGISVQKEPKRLTLAFKPGAAEFAPAEGELQGLAATEETNPDKVRDLLEGLKGLKIVDVLPKEHLGITPDLKQGRNAAAKIVAELRAQGFIPVAEGAVVSIGGETRVETKEGLIYTLRFGLPDAGLRAEKADLGADGKPKSKADAKADPKAAPEAKPADGKDKKVEQGGRYLLLTVAFDETKFPAIPDPAEPKLDPPAAGAKPDPEGDKKKLEDKKVLAAADVKAKREQRQKDLDNARKRATELQARYEKWYYIVGDEDYRKAYLDRAALVRPKQAKPEDKKPDALPSGLDEVLPAPKAPPPAPKEAQKMPAAAPPAEKAPPPAGKTPPPVPAPPVEAKPTEKPAAPPAPAKSTAPPAPASAPAAKTAAPPPQKKP